MNLRDGVLAVRERIGEGNPWLYSNERIISDLNRSANTLLDRAQANQATYRGLTKAPVLDAQGVSVGQQEYELPLDFASMIQCKIQIGCLYPVTFMSQGDLQVGPYVASLPLTAYLRRGTLLTTQTPSVNNNGGGEEIQPPSIEAGPPRWIIGFYPIPTQVYQFFVDYYSFHPVMKEPEDLCLLPDGTDFFEAWIAYPLANCRQKAGDDAGYQACMATHYAGVPLLSQYMLDKQWQANPPQYGDGDRYRREPTDITTIATTDPRILRS